MDRQANGINEVERRPSKMLLPKLTVSGPIWEAAARCKKWVAKHFGKHVPVLCCAAFMNRQKGANHSWWRLLLTHKFAKRIRNLSMQTTNYSLLSTHQVTHFWRVGCIDTQGVVGCLHGSQMVHCLRSNDEGTALSICILNSCRLTCDMTRYWRYDL